MSTTELSTKRAVVNASSASGSDGDAARPAAERIQSIATTAYYLAQARNFTPGREMDDWLVAEARFDRPRIHA